MNKIYTKCFKRVLDIFFSIILIVVLSPLFVILIILVRCKIGSPVLFRQERPGKNKKIFTIYKFRTMKDVYDVNGDQLPDEKRSTLFGEKMRSSSLDELPELFNILKGNMSFIGPRPLLIKYLTRYDEKQSRRHEVQPGLTGLAQVNGRNAITWEQKFEYDVEYIDKISFLLDVKILFSTIGIVFRREGINEAGQTTMSEFMGDIDNK